MSLTQCEAPFVRFLFVSGAAALVNILGRMAFNRVTSYELAIVLAFPIALTFAFVLNRLFVFKKQSRPFPRQYARFTLVNILALGQVWLVSVGLARGLFPFLGFTWHAETAAHVIGVLSPAATSYYAHKYFSFADERETS